MLVSEQRTSFEGYFTRLFALSDVDKLSCLLLPAGALLGVLYLLLNRQSSQPMPTLTVLLCAFGAVTPFSLLRAYDAPYARLSGHAAPPWLDAGGLVRLPSSSRRCMRCC